MISFRTDQEIEASVTTGKDGFRYQVGPYGSKWYRTRDAMEAALAARFPHAKLPGGKRPKAANDDNGKEQSDAQPVSRPRGGAADVGERPAEAVDGKFANGVPGQRELSFGKGGGGRARAAAAKPAKSAPAKPAKGGRREQAVDRGRDRGKPAARGRVTAKAKARR